MIQRTFKIDKVDQPFIDGLYSLAERGINIHFTTDVEAGTYNDREYALPRSCVATLHVETRTAEEHDAFDSWMEKENFRLALKGIPVPRCVSESYYLVI